MVGVKTCKPAESELPVLQHLSKSMAEANAAKAKADKIVESSKEGLAKWLLEQRDINIETLQIGDMVMIENVVLIEIGKQERFDEKGFLVSEPALHAQWVKPRPVKKFKSIA
jgi:hypothetical protein